MGYNKCAIMAVQRCFLTVLVLDRPILVSNDQVIQLHHTPTAANTTMPHHAAEAGTHMVYTTKFHAGVCQHQATLPTRAGGGPLHRQQATSRAIRRLCCSILLSCCAPTPRQ